MTSKKADSPTGADTYKRLLGYAAPHWRVFIVAALGMALFALADVSFIYLVKPLLDGSFVEKDPFIIRIMPPAILGLFLLRGVSSFISTYGMSWIGRRVIRDLRQELFDHLLCLPVSFYDRVPSSALITRLSYHVEQVAESTTTVVTTVLKEGLTVIGLIGLMFHLDWRLTLFTIIVGPIIAVLIRFVSARFRKIGRRIQDSVGGITHAADEAMQNHRVVKIYGGEGYERAKFEKANDHNRWLVLKMTATQASSTALVQFIAAWAVAGVVFFSTRPDMLADITPGTFVSYMGAMLALLGPIKQLTTINERLQKGIAAADNIFTLMDERTEPDQGTRPLSRARGDIEYREVDFRYRADAPLVLRDIGFTIEAGTTVAFVGRSGSGKSTLLGLLPRFYDPSAGTILVDGVDARDYPLGALRRQIAVVDQQVRLFNASVAENIAYGLESKPDRAAIEQAARHAYAWEFIKNLPRGLDTAVGQNGVTLSGGQRQRLAIARALLKDAPILILDEATSALDTESERYIQQALEHLVKGRTTLVIAHRLSTIQNADRIVAMQDGAIIETGTHEQLLDAGGLYASLYRMQFEDAAADAQVA